MELVNPEVRDLFKGIQERTGEISRELAPQYWGTFMENPSWRRAVSALLAGGTSMAVAIPTSLLFGPQAGAAILSAAEAGPIYDEAIAAGKSPREAMNLALAAGIATFALERYGLERVMGATGGRMARLLKGAAVEVPTEQAQTIVQNMVKLYGYDETQQILEGIVEATIGGLAGGPAAVVAGQRPTPAPEVRREEAPGAPGAAPGEEPGAPGPEAQPEAEVDVDAAYGDEAAILGATTEEELAALADQMASRAEATRGVELEVPEGGRFEAFLEQISDIVEPEQAEAVGAILQARARAVGMTPDEYLEFHNLQVERAEAPDPAAATEEQQVFQQAAGPQVDPAALPREVLSRMNRTLKAMGYDVRGADDVREIMQRSTVRDGVLWHPDWVTAYEKATVGRVERQRKAEAKKLERDEAQNVNWDRVRELGTTNDVNEAGYITPEGRFVDLSGKREGGTPGKRAYDHREAGGASGMQEFVALGNIRMDANSGMVDLAREPTAAQNQKLSDLSDIHNGELIVELKDGLGEWDERQRAYRQPERRFYREYPEGTRSTRIVNDIKKFYAGEEPLPLRSGLLQAEGAAPTVPPKAAIDFSQEGQTIIRAFAGADISSLPHELGHLFRRDLGAEDLAIAEDWAEVQNGRWTEEAEEKFARGFERYLADGQAPTPELARIFEQFKQWMLEIYRVIKESPIGADISPEIRGVFDRLLTEQETADIIDPGTTRDPETGEIRYAEAGESLAEDVPGGRVEGRADAVQLPGEVREDVGPTPPATPPVQPDLFGPDTLPDEPTAREEQLTSNFRLQVELETTDTVTSRIPVIDSAADAAHVFAPYQRKAQEQYLALVLDENRKPLAVLRHSVGITGAALVDPGLVAGSVLTIPGAESVYLAHNHPSGETVMSPQDRAIGARVNDLFRGTGVEVRAHLILGEEGRAQAITPRGDESVVSATEAKGRKRRVDVQERVFVHREARPKIDGPAKIPRVFADLDLGDTTGVLFLDARNGAIGFVPFTEEEMGALRQGPEGGLNRMLRAIHGSAAVHAIIRYQQDGMHVENIARALRQANVQPVDAAPADGGETYSQQGRAGQSLGDPKGQFFQAAQREPLERTPTEPVSADVAEVYEGNEHRVPIGQINIAPPKVLFQLDEPKWEYPAELDIFGTVNIRLGKELEIFEQLLGPVSTAAKLPRKVVEGARKRTRTIRAYDLGTALYAARDDGRLQRLLDPKVSADELAKERGVRKKDRERFDRDLKDLRSGPLYAEIDTKGRPILSRNGKAAASVDLLLATCQPTTPCQECYAAVSMVRMAGVRKALRTTAHLIVDPQNFGRRVAEEAKKVPKTALPFLRLLGSGDMTSSETVEAFNAIAQHADRPIQIFSRHHDNLGKLVGTTEAPFIKMGSVDADLVDHYGLDYLTDNMKERGINNAWLYTDASEISDIETLHNNEALGLILSASPKLHAELPYKLRRISCPCDAHERSYVGSCRQCALSYAGCFVAFSNRAIDTNGKIWALDEEGIPQGSQPVLQFLRGVKAKTPQGVARSRVVQDLIRDSIRLIREHMKRLEKGEQDHVALKDIRWPEDRVTLRDQEKAKGPQSEHEIHMPRGDVLASAEAYIENLQAIRVRAEEGDFYLPGGEIQPPVAYQAWREMAQPELISKEDAQNILFQTDEDAISAGTGPEGHRPDDTRPPIQVLPQAQESVKSRIRRITGQTDVSARVSERQALRSGLMKAARAAREAHRQGNREGVAAQRARMKGLIRDEIHRRKRRESVKTLRARIKAALKRTRVKKQAGKPVGKFTPEIQEALDRLREISKLKKDDAAVRLAENLDRWADELPPPEVVLENRLLEAVARVDSMDDPEALAGLLDDIKALIGEGRAVRGMQLEEIREERREAREATIEELGGLPEGMKSVGLREFLPRTRREAARRQLHTLGKTIVGWNDILDILSAKSATPAGQSFISRRNNVLGVKNREKRGMRRAMQQVHDDYRAAYGLTSNRQILRRIYEDNTDEIVLEGLPFLDGEGNPVPVTLRFTRAELRKRAMELMDPSLWPTFEEGMNYNENVAAEIFEALTEADKDYIQRQLNFYREYYDGMNEVYREMYGVNLPKNEWYSPISREGVAKPEESFGDFMQEVAFRASAATAGALKSRVGSIKTLEKRSDIAVLQRHIVEMEHFKAWARKVRDLNAVWKDPNVRAAIEIHHGKDMIAMVDSFISDMAFGGNQTAQRLRGWDRFRVNYTKAALGIRPSILIKQLTSFVAYADAMPVTEFAKYHARFWRNPVKNAREILENSELMKERGQNVDRDIKAAMKSEEYSAFSKTQSFTNMLLLNVKLGDQGAIVMGGWPYYQWLRDTQGMSQEQAIEAFERYTEQTQQSGDISEQSYWQRGGTLAKLTSMFASSPNQYLRKEIAAVRNYLSGRQGAKATLKTLVIYHFVLPMFFQFVSDRFTWDRDEQIRAAVFGPLNGWFLFGDGIDYVLRAMLGMQQFDMEIPVYSVFHDLVKMAPLVDLFDLTSDEFFRAIRAAAGVLGAVTGTPTKQVVEMGKGAVDIMDTEYEQGLAEIMGYSPYIAEEAAKR